jgi:hypothetical protein
VDLAVHEKKIDGDEELAAADEQGARAEDVGVHRVAELGWEAEQRRRRLFVGLAVEVHFALVMVAVRGSVWKDSTDKMCAGVGPAVLATRHVTLLAHGSAITWNYVWWDGFGLSHSIEVTNRELFFSALSFVDLIHRQDDVVRMPSKRESQ